MKKNILIFSGLVALLCAVPPLAAYLPAPLWLHKGAWIAGFLSLTIFFFTLSSACRASVIVYACISLGSVALALCLAESYYRIKKEPELYGVYTTSQRQDRGELRTLNDSLRFNPAANCITGMPGPMNIGQRKIRSDTRETLFDSIYTTNALGWRATPERGAAADTAVLLFGCSFTFGEGVENEQTYAWRLGELLGEKYQVFNLALCGYGSHQMLSMLERGFLNPILEKYKHIYPVFLAIAAHPARVVGYENYDQTAPRYVLGPSGLSSSELLTPKNTMKRIDAALGQSALYRKAKNASMHTFYPEAPELYAAIIAESAKILQRDWQAELTVMVWPNFSELIPRLRAHSLQVLDLSPALPDWQKTHLNYELAFYDGHPNARGHDVVARALYKHLREKGAVNASAPEAR